MNTFAATQPGATFDLSKMTDRVEDAFRWGDFTELERLLALAEQPGARSPTGLNALRAFRRGVDRGLASGKYSSAYFSEMEAYTLELAKVQPNSPLAHVLHAQTLLEHGWWYRGTGYNNTVPPEARREFNRRVELAAQYMVAHADVALKSTLGHSMLINIGRSAGWPIERQWLIAKEGLKIDPDDDDLYFGVLWSALPKWGGSPAAVDRVIAEAVSRTRSTRGYELYARLYAEASDQEFRANLFSDSRADWALMKQGYLDLISRFDTPERHNQLAYFACLARDKPTFLDQLEKLGDEPDYESWGSNPKSTYQSCRQWAGSQ